MHKKNFNFENRIPILTDYVNKVITDPPGEPTSGVPYVYNDYGYRSFQKYEKLLDVKDKIVTIGCSFTFGIGLHLEETWPTHLSALLDRPVLNLSLPGASHGYVIWQLLNTLRNVQTENIFIVIPPKGRLFQLTEYDFENVNRLEGFDNIETRCVLENAENDDLLLKSLCTYNNIPYIECYQYGQPYHEKWLPPARDGGHFGERWNEFIAKEFYKIIEK